MAAPSIYHRDEDGVKMSVHVDEPLVLVQQGQYGWDSALRLGAWRLLILCVVSGTWGRCTTPYQEDTWRWPR